MNTAANRPLTVAEMVQDAEKRVQSLSVEQVVQELEKGAVLVDLRESEELRQEGVIPGSIHAPRGMLEFYADPTSPYHRQEFAPERRTILHCAAGKRSVLAADTLMRMGYGNVAHLEGGIKAWKAQGRPTMRMA